MRVRLLEKAFGYEANDVLEMSVEMATAVIIRGIAITAGITEKLTMKPRIINRKLKHQKRSVKRQKRKLFAGSNKMETSYQNK